MKIGTELLPPLPPRIDESYGWITQLGRDGWWTAISSWGSDGWDLGRWPYVVIAHFTGRNVYAVAEFVEGDVTVAAFDNRAERDAYTDGLALYHWRQFGSGPDDLPATVEQLPARYRGPYCDEACAGVPPRY